MNSFFTITSKEYVQGTICLIKSLKRVTKKKITVIEIELSSSERQQIEKLNVEVKKLPPLNKKYYKDKREDLIKQIDPKVDYQKWCNNCLAKLNLWNLTEFKNIVYLDSDMIVLKNIDELFNKSIKFGACPSHKRTITPKGDIIDSFHDNEYFNSGMLVLQTSKAVFERLMKAKDEVVTEIDNADQELLNYCFKNFVRLKPIYNWSKKIWDIDKKQWNENLKEIKVLHFCSITEKPWKKRSNCPLNKLWWEIYES